MQAGKSSRKNTWSAEFGGTGRAVRESPLVAARPDQASRMDLSVPVLVVHTGHDIFFCLGPLQQVRDGYGKRQVNFWHAGGAIYADLPCGTKHMYSDTA